MNYSTNQTISMLEKMSDQTEIKFKNLLPVKTNSTYCLMYIKSVELDASGKLFITDGRGKETEVTDNLMYCQFILKTINEEILKSIPQLQKSEPWIN